MPFGIGRERKREDELPPGGGEDMTWPEREQEEGAEAPPPVEGGAGEAEGPGAEAERPSGEGEQATGEGERATGDGEQPTSEQPTADDESAPEAGEEEEEERSRVAVVSEPERGAGDEEEWRWHTGLKRPTGVPDAIEFIDVHKSFGRNRILRGLNMGLPEGKISMILGPSATGKPVCIKHMDVLLYPDEGDVLVHGESVPNLADDELFDMRKKFGVLFQDGALFGSMNLYDNVAFPLRQHTDKSEEEVAEIVNRRLREVGLADSGDKMPNELSGGMRKRAGFAR